MDLKDKVVIVTGGGNGVGAATARRYVECGARVVLADWDDKAADKVAESLGRDRAEAVHIDVSNPDAVKAMMDDIAKRYGRIDVLVNNAGVHVPGSVIDCSVEDWRKIAGVDIDGVVFCSKFVMPYLLKSKGNIVNTASVSGLGGDWGAAFYCAAKGAVVNLTRAMALDHGAQGVRINAVCPSLIKTNMTNSWPQEVRDKFNDRIALGRAAEPEEIANVIVFLSSPLASFINGANIATDGGATASNGQPKIV